MVSAAIWQGRLSEGGRGMFEFIDEELRVLGEKNLLRSLRHFQARRGMELLIDGRWVINFASNDYLGLTFHPRVLDEIKRALQEWGWGAGAARLMSGSSELHARVEDRIAHFEGCQAALLFPTGFMANIGAIQALVGHGDAIIVDRFNHASIIDGARLCKARLFVYKHCNTSSLEKILVRTTSYRRRLVVTDSVFSMDGDIAPLPDIVALCRKYDAMLMVDEAHGTGVWGKGGKGASELLGVHDDIPILMGTLSKALGGLGGFIAGENNLIRYLRNRARSFIYTTAPPPPICAGVLAALDIIESDEGRALRERLQRMSRDVREYIRGLGFDTGNSTTQIIPVIFGDVERALKASYLLFDLGIFAPAVRPPTVPEGSARIRISLSAGHTDLQIERLTDALKQVKKEVVGNDG